MKDIVDINSISEYIQFIEKNNLYNYLSRGEYKYYKTSNTAHALRDAKWRNAKLLESFRFEVNETINDFQRNNLLAFAQHYGMPTQLLDTSRNHLVSLYFATEKSSYESNKNDSGYVYFFDNQSIIDIEDYIIPNETDIHLSKKFIDFEQETITMLFNHCEAIYINSPDNFSEYYLDCCNNISLLINTLMYEIKFNYFIKQYSKDIKELELFIDIFKSSEELFKKTNFHKAYNILHKINSHFLEIIKYIEKYIDVHKAIKNIEKHASKYDENLGQSMVLLKYIELLLRVDYIHKISDMEEHIANKNGKCHDGLAILEGRSKPENYHLLNERVKKFGIIENPEYISFPWIFTYRPPLFDERIKNQSSWFIYQLNFDILHRNKTINVRHKLNPNYKVAISNKNHIRKELDCLGINSKFIYADIDHVSKYVLEKHLYF